MPDVISVDVKSLSKAFYTARKSIRLGVESALQKSGKPLLDEVKRRAPTRRKKLRAALKFAVKYDAGSASLSIVSNDAKVDKYFMVREDGPEGGIIAGQPILAWVPEFSPFYSLTATVESAKEKARSAGYTYFFQPQGSKILLGVRRKRRGRKRSWVKVGAEFAPVAILTPEVHQQGKPYIQPAIEQQMPSIQERIISELTRVFNGNN
jgi:hypothetical protein